MSHNILVVDDDTHVIESFELIVGELNNCKLFYTTKPENAPKIVLENKIDLLFIDIVLPNTTGYDVCKELRVLSNASKAYCILMSSDRKQLLDRIRAYKVGAQEFLIKPFDLKEVELLIKSKIEFFIQNNTNNQEKEKSYLNTFGKFILDEKNQEIKIGKQKLDLTPIEYSILKFFLSKDSEIIEIEDISKKVWEEGSYQLTAENFRTHIYRLRQKIEPDPKNPIYLVSKKNLGYIFYCTGLSFLET